MLKGLSFFRRTSCAYTYNVAAYHSPHSLTWSWCLSFYRPRADEGRWLGFYWYRDNGGLQWGVQFARHMLAWKTQKPMWYRDLCQTAWGEQDRLTHEMARMRLKLEDAQHAASRAASVVPTGLHIN